MKKLMTMLAAVATAFGLYAADPVSYGTSFEGIEAGTSIFADQTEGAQWTQGTVPADKALVTTYESAGITPITGNLRPDQFVDADQDNYLDVKTTLGNPIARKLDTAWNLSAGNFYSDTLVRFTNFDSDPEIASDAKIAVWVQEIEGENGAITTNLMVTARGADGNPTNFLVAANWTPALADGWSRVTIKAIPSILKTGTMPGFVVWVDKVPAGCDEAKAVVDGLSLELSDIAAVYNENGQLFVSMVQDGAAISTINAIAFDGQGQIDDVSLTSSAPSFAADPQFFYLDGDANVVSLQVNTTLTFTKEQLPVTLPWDDKDTAYDVVATYANGYVDGTWTITAGTVANGTFKPGVGGATGTVVSKAAFVKLTCKVGGEDTTVYAADFAAAVEAIPSGATDVKFTLTQDLESANAATIASAVTLDLNGKTYTYNGEGYAFTATAAFTITDSSEAQTGAIAATQVVTASNGLTIDAGIFGGAVTITAGAGAISGGTFDGAFTAQGKCITGGKFKNDPRTYVATGYDATEKDGYWVVGLAEYTIYYWSEASEQATALTATPTTYTYNQDTLVLGAPTETKPGYTFDKWFDAETSAEFAYAKGRTGDINVYATWTANEYTVTFKANGGSGTQESIPYTWGDAITAPVCTFEAPEKGTFNCWSNAVSHATYAEGVTLPTDCESYELVADWTIQAGPDYPPFIPDDDPVVQADYDAWKTGPGSAESDFTGGDAEKAKKMEASFLLNCAPTEEALAAAKDAFKFTEITIDAEGNVVFKIADKTVTAAELAYNGYLVIKGKQSLDEKEWHAKDEGDQFFKAELTVTAPEM